MTQYGQGTVRSR